MDTKRDLFGRATSDGPVAIVNNTGCNIDPYYAEILASLKATGKLPEELSDLFVAIHVKDNDDGSPRWRLDAA